MLCVHKSMHIFGMQGFQTNHRYKSSVRVLYYTYLVRCFEFQTTNMTVKNARIFDGNSRKSAQVVHGTELTPLFSGK